MPLALPAVALQVAPVAAAAPAALSPVLDRPYRVLTSQRHRNGDTEHRYDTERRVVFRREPGGGLVADMVLLSVTTDRTGAAAKRFADAVGALRGETMRVRLAGDGTVLAIEDEERLRAMVAAAVAAVSTAAPSPPPPIDRAALAAPLTALLAGTAGQRPAGSRPVTLPAATPGGTPLAGTETALPMPGGRLRLVVRAAGTVGITAIDVMRERTVDTRSGLIADQRETQTTRLGDRTLVITDETLLIPPV